MKVDNGILHTPNKEVWREAIRKVSRAFRDKPEQCIPIYDSDGNMLWPKTLSHKEIIQQLGKEPIGGSADNRDDQ